MPARLKTVLLAASLAPALALAGCATIQREPFNETEQADAAIPGMPQARFWADAPGAARLMAPEYAGAQGERSMLALSGGSDNGAYGAGLLEGWTKSGTRPEFAVVTGVSTGALIAPFAFLGPDQDETLEKLFTGISARNIYKNRFPLAIPLSPSIASTSSGLSPKTTSSKTERAPAASTTSTPPPPARRVTLTTRVDGRITVLATGSASTSRRT